VKGGEGDGGDPRYLAFAVVGDTVNVASPLAGLDSRPPCVTRREPGLIDAVRAEEILEEQELAATRAGGSAVHSGS
jgi:hypothetical protein